MGLRLPSIFTFISNSSWFYIILQLHEKYVPIWVITDFLVVWFNIVWTQTGNEFLLEPDELWNTCMHTELSRFLERSSIPRTHLSCELCHFPVYETLWCGCSTSAQPYNKKCVWVVFALHNTSWLSRLAELCCYCSRDYTTLSLGNSLHQSHGPQNTFYTCWLGQNLWFCLAVKWNKGLAF